jgi:hypothetical protein
MPHLGDFLFFRMISQGLYEMWPYADKLTAKRIARSRIGSEYIVPTHVKTNILSQQTLDDLPFPFIIKANNGSGRNLICKNAEDVNLQSIQNFSISWINENYYFKFFEKQYQKITPTIFAEMYLGNQSTPCIDIKLFCVKGSVVFYAIEDPYSDVDFTFSRIGELCHCIPDSLKTCHENLLSYLPRTSIAKIILLADHLSKEFYFVRIDLYYCDNKVYFGEYTLTPSAGLLEWDSVSSFLNRLIQRRLKETEF